MANLLFNVILFLVTVNYVRSNIEVVSINCVKKLFCYLISKDKNAAKLDQNFYRIFSLLVHS